MKILIYATDGSRGDIQPYLALAHALNAAGHTAVFAAPRLYESLATEHGVPFAPLNDELVQLQSRPDIRQLYLNNDKLDAQKRIREAMTELFPRIFPILLREMWEAASAGADLIVYSPSSRQAAHQIAERLGVPHALGALYPHYVASREYPPGPGLTPTPTSLQDHARVNAPLKPPISDWIADWRSDVLGLPPRDGSTDFRFDIDGNPTPVIHSFSPHVLKPATDWPEWVHTTGFWSLPRRPDWEPPKELVHFMENGEKPISVGFGSSFGLDPEATGRTILEAIQKSGKRAVVVGGWGGIRIDDPPESVITVNDVPYDWLFPRVAAAVHAGGVGTFNIALKAGIPQVACPFHNEQMMWAQQLHALGVAPAPLSFRTLTVEALATSITTALTDADIAAAVRGLADKVGTENGGENAVRVLERIHSERTAVGRPGREA